MLKNSFFFFFKFENCDSSFHGNSMNILLFYCGLVDARISASEKDLPVHTMIK